MKMRIFFYFLVLISFIVGMNSTVWAYQNLPNDPNWLFNKELKSIVPGWDEGYVICKPPKGGYNEIVENQKILNSWGYKARPIEEIKDLLPEPYFNIISKPDVWGTFRINETDYNSAGPRGMAWEKYQKISKKNIGVCYIDESTWLRNWEQGLPFPVLDENDPQLAVKLIWNFIRRFQPDDRIVNMDLRTVNRRGTARNNLVINRRLMLRGRNNSEEPLYKPNPKNIDFAYATPYIAPYNLRGTIPLYYRYDNPVIPDDMWIYIPSLRRVRRMSTAQHQDRLPGGLDWTWDNTEGFEGSPTRFHWTYLGRKELLYPVLCKSITQYDSKGLYLNGNDQYYQRRNTYVVKASYKKPINMTDIILYLDPDLFCASYSVDTDLKGRTWIVQTIPTGRDKGWYYTQYNGFTIDILTKHATVAFFGYSGNNVGFTLEDLALDSLKKVYLSR